MRHTLIVLVLALSVLPASAIEGAWSLQVPSVVYAQPTGGDVDLVVPIGANRSAAIRLETAADADPVRARIYVFEVLFADCLIGDGAPVCETRVIELWDAETPDPVPARDIRVRIESDADYVLTVIGYATEPAAATHFLPGIYR